MFLFQLSSPNWFATIFLFLAIAFLLYQRFFPKPRIGRLLVSQPANVQLINTIVEELYPLFKSLKEIRRLNRSEFVSFCHSSMSGGIARSIRNDFNMWIIADRRQNGGFLKGEVTNQQVLLYDTLANMYGVAQHPDTGKKYIHPDEASSRLVGIIYDYFHLMNPEAKEEVQRFTTYCNSPAYEPHYPFDVRYPHEKPERNKSADFKTGGAL